MHYFNKYNMMQYNNETKKQKNINLSETNTALCFTSNRTQKIDSYESYLVSDYTIYIAFIHDRYDFINFISQQKIIFPQVALLVSIVKMNISLCNLCLSYGCKIDENCITLACITLNCEMIEYCIKNDVLPTKNDIDLIFQDNSSNQISQLKFQCQQLYNQFAQNKENYHILNSLFYQKEFTDSANFVIFCKSIIYDNNNYIYEKHILFNNFLNKYFGDDAKISEHGYVGWIPEEKKKKLHHFR